MGLYDCDRFGSDFLAADDGCDDRYSGFTARWPAAGCEEGILWAALGVCRWMDIGSRSFVVGLFVERERGKDVLVLIRNDVWRTKGEN